MQNMKTVRKWYWVWQFEEEEAWLNLMAQEGWVLDKVGLGVYHFISCEPGSYQIALEMRDPEDSYIAFMQDMGAQYVGRILSWLYWRRPTQNGPFTLFSDLDSRIQHLNRIAKTLKGVGIANLVIGLANSINPVMPPLGWINLLCACWVMYCLGRIQSKLESLEKDRQLHE